MLLANLKRNEEHGKYELGKKWEVRRESQLHLKVENEKKSILVKYSRQLKVQHL